MKNNIVKIDDRLSYITPYEDPLSSNVGIITLGEGTYLFDVGAHPEALETINELKRPKNIILSHFHKDHIFNISNITYDNLYVSSQTYKYTKAGTIVSTDIYLEDGLIHIFPIPSSHSKGCLGLEVDGTYAFLGDATYVGMKDGEYVYNAGLLKEQIDIISSLKAAYAFQSHRHKFMVKKELVIKQLLRIYGLREPGCQYIKGPKM